MRLRYINIVVVVLCGFINSVRGTINFGSRNAEVLVTGTLDLSGIAVDDGTLSVAGGTLVTTEAIPLTDITFDNGDSTFFVIDGLLVDSEATITRLMVHDALVPFYLTTSDSVSSSIEGSGRFAYDIGVPGSLYLSWGSPMNVNIDLYGSVVLGQDLTFIAGSFFIGGGEGAHSVDCNGHRLLFGGDTTTLVINDSLCIANTDIQLTGPVFLSTLIMFSGAGLLQGGGTSFEFDSEEGVMHNGGYQMTLTDIVFKVVTPSSFQGNNNWVLNNITLQDAGSNSVTISGAIQAAGGAIDVFGVNGGTVILDALEAADISLNGNCEIGGTWQFNYMSLLNGNGYTLSLGDGALLLHNTMCLADITLSELGSSSLKNDDAYSFFASNVTWLSPAYGGISVNGLPGYENGAQISIADEGHMFISSNTYWYGAVIELLSDVSFFRPAELVRWWFNDDCVLDGRGNVLDLSGGSLAVAAGKTVYLRNVVLDNVQQNSFVDGGGIFDLSNVTIKLSGSIDISSWNSVFYINGPVTFITGTHTFTVDDSSTISGVTVYYDTLSEIDWGSVRGFSCASGGRLLFRESPLSGIMFIYDTGSVHLGRDEYLAVANTTAHVAGRTIVFTSGGLTTYNGLGRSLFFPATDDEVVTVAAATSVATTNIVLQGLRPSNLDVQGSLCFGNGTIIRLTNDWILDKPLLFGTATDALNEYMVLDLCGQTIDMSDSNAAIVLRGTNSNGVNFNTLRICNGRLLNLSGQKISGTEGSKIIFDDVEIVLSDTYSCANNVDIDVHGNCLVRGTLGAVFDNASSARFTINVGSTLTIMDMVTYFHNTTVANNFIMTDTSSCLELIGGTFKHWVGDGEHDPLVLTTGTLIIDHRSTIHVGSPGVMLGNDVTELNVQIRPGASLIVAGAGTLTLGGV